MIDGSIKIEFEKTYAAYVETKETTAEMNKGVKDLIKVLAKKMEIKPGLLSKALNYKYKKAEMGEDDLSDVQTLLSALE